MLDDFIPVNIKLAEQIGLVDAAVAGAIWLKWNIKKKVCNAGTRELGRTCGLNHSTVSNSIKRLVKSGLIEDSSPDRRGAPHDLIPSVDLINTLCKASVDVIDTLPESVDLIDTSVDLINKEEVKEGLKDIIIINAQAEKSLTAITSNYEDTINVSISPILADEFRQYASKVKPDWVFNAFKVAEDNQVLKWSYVRAILDSCIRAGKWENKKPKINGNGNSRGKQNEKSKASDAAEQQQRHLAEARKAIAEHKRAKV